MCIKYIDGEVIEVSKNEFDSYEMNHGLLMLSKGSQMIAAFNMSEIKYWNIED